MPGHALSLMIGSPLCPALPIFTLVGRDVIAALFDFSDICSGICQGKLLGNWKSDPLICVTQKLRSVLGAGLRSVGAARQPGQRSARACPPPSPGHAVLGQTLPGCSYLPHSTVHPSYKHTHTHVHMVLIIQVCALSPVGSLNASLVVNEGVKVRIVVELGVIIHTPCKIRRFKAPLTLLLL